MPIIASTIRWPRRPRAVRDLLGEVWPRALKRALADRDALQALVQAEGGNFKIAPWDWRYYAEKLRKRLHDVDEAATKPYLQLDRIIEAAFDTATRLFGLRFKELKGIPVWHPDVRVWDVTDAGRPPCRACSSAIISRGPPSIAAPG